MLRLWTVLAAGALAFAMTADAMAHTGTGAGAGFLSGFGHPLSGWDHIAAMVAVGLWGAQLGPPGIWVLPITFPLMMATGGFMGLVGLQVPAVEVGIAASAIVLGLAVTFEVRLALWVSMTLIGVFAIFHGFAHGAELEEGADPLAYSLGFVVATGLLHAFGILIGALHRWKLGERTVQALGAVVAVAGAGFLYQAVA